MTVEIHSSFDDVRDEWKALATRTGATPFHHPGWFENWWDAFGRGEAQILGVRQAGSLTGILPLEARRNGLTSMTNWHTALFGGVYANRDAADALAETLLDLGTTHIRLRFLDPADPLVGALQAAGERRGIPMLQRTMHLSPYVPLDGTWEDYDRSLSKNQRRGILRRERRLREMGDLRLEVEDGRERLEDLLQEGFKLEAAGWKGAKGTAILSDPRTLSFYVGLSRWAAAAGLLRLAFIRLDGRAIAFNLCFEHQRVHYALKPGHDPELANYGLGSLLMYRMIARSFALGHERHELLGHADEFKRSFAGDHAHPRLEVQAFSRSLRGGALRFVEERVRPLARRVLAARR